MSVVYCRHGIITETGISQLQLKLKVTGNTFCDFVLFIMFVQCSYLHFLMGILNLTLYTARLSSKLNYEFSSQFLSLTLTSQFRFIAGRYEPFLGRIIGPVRHTDSPAMGSNIRFLINNK